jgi:NADH-quinone oxidoreductase subunit A
MVGAIPRPGLLGPAFGSSRKGSGFPFRLAKELSPLKFRTMEQTQVAQDQLLQYLPVLMLLILAVVFSGGMIVVSVLLGKKGKRPPIKDTPYECGMLPVGPGSTRLSVKFYLVAMLFILFDIEVVFLYPWAVVYRQMLKENGAVILGSMLSFMGILFVGYIYALKKKAFDWTS